ncbi:MAG: hypothetical protein D6693_10060 [Planctomycetota bacterium]|nr:MAG: hypothetical protein D6693_10060 [Planctomycetota bacterium]
MINPITDHALVALAAAGSPHDSAAAPPPDLTGWELAAENALFLVVDAGIVALSIAFLMCLHRLVTGPTLVDRGIASDTLAMQVVGLAILLTIRMRTLMFFDAVLIISILGFASTVAFAQFIARRRSA